MAYHLLQVVKLKKSETISSCDIKIERVKKNAEKAALVVEGLVSAINDELMDAAIIEEEKRLELADTLDFFDKSKNRDNEEGDVLVVGDNVIMKRRVGRSQVKGNIACLKLDDSNGAVKYDVTV